MGFVAEDEKDEETQSPSITGSKASSLGDTWWWQNVKPFVNGGLATVLAGIPISLGGVATYNCLTKNDREYLTNAIKRLGCLCVCLALKVSRKFVVRHLLELLERFASSPFYAALARLVGKKMTYGNLYKTLYHIGANEGLSVFWNAGGLKKVAAYYAGMLPAYNQSFHYFKVSCGLDENETRRRAGVVSAFFSTACNLPFHNVQLYMHAMRAKADGKFQFKSSLDCALKVLKAGGLGGVYRGFPLLFLNFSLPITVLPPHPAHKHMPKIM